MVTIYLSDHYQKLFTIYWSHIGQSHWGKTILSFVDSLNLNLTRLVTFKLFLKLLLQIMIMLLVPKNNDVTKVVPIFYNTKILSIYMFNLYISSINKLFANINNRKRWILYFDKDILMRRIVIVFPLHICHFYKAYVSCLSV